MSLDRLVTIVILTAALGGCIPTPEDAELPRIYDTLEYKLNVSRLFGDGGKLQTDANGTLASNIIWKDSTGVLRSLEEYQGNVIVLNMWASWCGPCRAELPDLQALADDYRTSGVRLVGVSIDRVQEPFRSVLEFAKDYDVTYQLIVDSAARAYLNYGGTGDIPRTYVIDRDGYLYHTFIGQVDREQLEEAIQAIL
jgi:thiol-disulfide isomerase/thioredoxin